MDFFAPDSSSSGSPTPVMGRVLCHISPRGSVISYNVLSKDHVDGVVDAGCDLDEFVTNTHEYAWSGIIWSKPIRKLINQSHGFFMRLQKMGGERGGAEPKVILEYSKRYRSAIRECVLGLKDQKYDEEVSRDDYDIIDDQIAMYAMLETAWHLCEILFLETLPLGCLIQQLLEWVRWQNQEFDEVYHTVMDSPNPDAEPEYWRVVYCLTLQGRPEDVTELLKHSPDCQRYPKVYNSISELLRKMPMVRSVVGKSRTELRGQWYEWKQECKRRRERGDFTMNDNLQLLCGLLCGDEESFKNDQVARCCEHWYELMVGKLLYCSPLIMSTDYDLHLTAESCITQCINPTDVGAFDKILLTALHNNIIDVIKISSSVLSDWWFVAHLSNVLYHKGSLVSHHFEYGSQLTEFVLIEYATSLFAHPSLWQISLDYLSHCHTQGRHHMMLLIERVPLDTEYKALKVLSVCNQYGLKDQAQSLCRVMARRSYSRNQLGNALTWSVRSKDTSFAAFIAEKYFEDYETTGNFKDLSLLDNLGDAMLLSKKLTFLGKYREMQVKYSVGDFTGAGQLITSLLESGTVPKKYWITLLTDTLPLLQLHDQIVFDSNQTHCLMRSLLNVETYLKQLTADSAERDISDQFDLNKEKMAVLRLSLVGNLKRALFN